MKIGSPEHRAWQKENGKKFHQRCREELKKPPVKGDIFDSMRKTFARNMLRDVSE